jgi:hypothetical protein
METTTRLSNLRRDLINTHNISKDMQMEFIHLDNDIRILKAKLKNHGVIDDVSKSPDIELCDLCEEPKLRKANNGLFLCQEHKDVC